MSECKMQKYLLLESYQNRNFRKKKYYNSQIPKKKKGVALQGE